MIRCQLCDNEATHYYLFQNEQRLAVCVECKEQITKSRTFERHNIRGIFIPIEEYDPKIYVKRRK